MSKPDGLFFIAEGPVRVVVRSEIPAIHNTAGQMIAPKQRRLFAQFVRGQAPKWAYDIGKEIYDANGRPDVPIERWLGFYDSLEDQRTNSWTDDESALIEEKLLQSYSCKQVAPAKLEAPWPAYDKLVAKGRRTIEMVAAKVAETALDTGLDPGLVARYEAENLNRPEVIQALHAAQAGPVDDVVESELVA